jgi:hypothetical protein
VVGNKVCRRDNNLVDLVESREGLFGVTYKQSNEKLVEGLGEESIDLEFSVNELLSI